MNQEANRAAITSSFGSWSRFEISSDLCKRIIRRQKNFEGRLERETGVLPVTKRAPKSSKIQIFMKKKGSGEALPFEENSIAPDMLLASANVKMVLQIQPKQGQTIPIQGGGLKTGAKLQITISRDGKLTPQTQSSPSRLTHSR
ncbi:hypothetical protein DWB84_05670 [Saccharophagus sp. K07]|jgi:hypothetical protein|uniref:hypothetical protein n=1 Tax=Saccharophagus sp. K07 TaxID=2283636 RepID=UPI00165241F3|nr:hypothetical protein [Saccharophagus sp. K07]MBC6904951.1 hypothetical protein [Saccharophagus sp. K07]